jgi:hypothetical protein
MFKSIFEVVSLPLISKRPDVRLLNNRIWPTFTPKSWAGTQESKIQFFKRENDKVMEAKNANKSRTIGVRLTLKEYEQIKKKWKASICRKLSDYVRRSIFEKPILTTYRNQSLDDFMAEMMLLRNELNTIGSNFNQAVKKLNSLQQITEFRS